MANLKLRIAQPIEVRRVDAEIEVRRTNNELLGHLLISKGSLDWRPANARSVHSVRWRTFAKWMEENH
jgi:hypothetical protein